MAKLFFYYSAMNAGKSTTLLQAAFNYRERGMDTLLLTAALDDRHGVGRITSRIGLEAEASVFIPDDDLLSVVKRETAVRRFDCVLVDEAQFLTRDQVWQLSDVVDKLDLPVLCYGIRTDFQGNLFEGSRWLLAWADTLSELKTICHCGRKAGMVLRLDAQGVPVKEGVQIEIGGNDKYLSVCRYHYKEAMGR